MMEAPPVQSRYADVLAKGMYLGLVILILTFVLYMTGVLAPHVPLEDLSRLWSMNVHDYLKASGAPTGWSWLRLLGKGDFLNFIGVAILAGVTIVCNAAIVPLLIKKKDHVYAVLAVLEIVILCLAASGILAVGH